jgi:hypothetical protein
VRTLRGVDVEVLNVGPSRALFHPQPRYDRNLFVTFAQGRNRQNNSSPPADAAATSWFVTPARLARSESIASRTLKLSTPQL